MATGARRAAIGRLHLLTAKAVHAAGDGDHSDGGGLLLRVSREGTSASWVYRYTAPSGKRREMGFGAAHRANVAQASESLNAARTAAARAREALRLGVDPLVAREASREAARAAEVEKKAEAQRERWTLARCAREYHERVIEPSRTAKHSALWIASLENHVPPALWHAPIDTVEAPALLAALLDVEPHPRARNLKGDTLPETVQRIRQRLEAAFEDAMFHGRCDSNPAAAIRRKMREAMPRRERGQYRALPFRDAPTFMAQLRAAEGVAARCLEFAMLTASRTSETLLAEWREIDIKAAVWTVPACHTKTKEAHTVYLSPHAVEVLRAQLALDSRLVFPSVMSLDMPDGKRKPMSNMSLLAVLDRLGYRDRTTVHGLCRATFSTWANETGAARPDAIEACLAHAEKNRVRAAYNRSDYARERRALLEKWCDYLASPPAEAALPAGVVPLHARRRRAG